MNINTFASQLINSGTVFHYVCRPNSFFNHFMKSKVGQRCSSSCKYGRSRIPLRYPVKCLNYQFKSSKLCQKKKAPDYISLNSFHIHNILSQNKEREKNYETTKAGTKEDPYVRETEDDSEKNLTLVQKFKLMYKQYWYVLIPVHLATSIVWYGSFFFMAKSGFDIVPLIEKMGVAEKVVDYLRNSNAGYYGIAYALYKVATPARYTVTLGGTTISINYLKNRGYIKPVPTKEELKTMYEDKRDEFKERTDEMREKYNEKRDELVEKYHDKTDEMREKYQEKKNEILEKYKMNKPNSEDKNR